MATGIMATILAAGIVGHQARDSRAAFEAAVRSLRASSENISQPMGLRKGGSMSTKKGSKKGSKEAMTQVSKARLTNPETGCKVGSIGNEIGMAYFAAKDYDAAVASAEEIVARSFKRKGKSEAKTAVHRHAVSWVTYLEKGFFPQGYKKHERKEETKAPAKKAVKKAPAKKASKKAPAKAPAAGADNVNKATVETAAAAA
jgi:hypothetical protein